MILNWDFWDIRAIVITLNKLNKDFDTTTASPLETGNKTIDQIQSILQSKKAKNICKQATGDIETLAMSFRDKAASKQKANSNIKCYNRHKLDHFGRNCFFLNRKPNQNTQQSQKKIAKKQFTQGRKSSRVK